MDVTLSNLAHEKLLYRKLLHQHPITELDFAIPVAPIDNTDTIINALDKLIQEFSTSFTTFTTEMTFEDLLSPKFIEWLCDHDVLLRYQDPKDRFKLAIDHEKKIKMELSKEVYEKFGIDGKKLDDKARRRFLVELDLRSPSLKLSSNNKLRSRILENASLLFKKPLNCQLTISKLSNVNGNYFANRTNLVASPSMCITKKELHLPLPQLFEQYNAIPNIEILEDLILWIGAISSDSNLILEPPSRLDPFISTCRLPTNDADPIKLIHYKLQLTNSFMSTLKICELLESIASIQKPLQSCYFIRGKNSLELPLKDFVMHVNHNLDFIHIEIGQQ